MKQDKNGYDLHVLICTNEKKNGSSCGPKGAKILVDELKKWSKSAWNPGVSLRVNQSGCLGRCEEGITCVAYAKAYAKGEWLVEVTPQDLHAVEAWISSLRVSE